MPEDMEKADKRTTPANFIIGRHPGQIPDRKGLSAKLVLHQANKIFKPRPEPQVTRMVPSVRHVVDNLGMSSGLESEWMTFLKNIVQPQVSEVSIRHAVIGKMAQDKMDPAMRRPLWDRVQAYWKHVQRNNGDLNKSHKYRRRWKGKDGKWQYEYDEPKPSKQLVLPLAPSQKKNGADIIRITKQLVDGEKNDESWARSTLALETLSDDLRKWAETIPGKGAIKRKTLARQLEKIRERFEASFPPPRVTKVGGLEVESLDTAIEQHALESGIIAIERRIRMMTEKDRGKPLYSAKDIREGGIWLGIRKEEQFGDVFYQEGKPFRRMEAQEKPTEKVLQRRSEWENEWRRNVALQLHDVQKLPRSHQDLLGEAGVRVRFLVHPSGTNATRAFVGGEATFDERTKGDLILMYTFSSVGKGEKEVGMTLAHEVGHIVEKLVDRSLREKGDYTNRDHDLSHLFESMLGDTAKDVRDRPIPDVEYHTERTLTWVGSSSEWFAEAYRYAYRDGADMATVLQHGDFDQVAFRSLVDAKVTQALGKGVHKTKKVEEPIDLIKGLVLGLDLMKAKYKRRWRGPDGKWRYEYDEPKKSKLFPNQYKGPLEPNMNLIEAELAIGGQPVEHVAVFDKTGAMVMRVRGNKTSCQFMPSQVRFFEKLDDAVFTHNHPAGKCLSVEDVNVAVSFNMAEIRATTKSGKAWVIRRPRNGWGVSQRDIETGRFAYQLGGLSRIANASASARMDRYLDEKGGPRGTDNPHFSQEMFDEFFSEAMWQEYKNVFDNWKFAEESYPAKERSRPKKLKGDERRRGGARQESGGSQVSATAQRQQPIEEKTGQLRLFKSDLLFLDLDLVKAQQGGKYIRRVPYTDKHGKRKYRYYYRESAAARGAQLGEEIRLGAKVAKVLAVQKDGTVTIAWDGNKETIAPDKWADKLANHYGDAFLKSAEKRARQTINAVLRHVPKKLLVDLKGDTDVERLSDLERRVPEVYAKLQKAFQRAGMSPYEAKRILSRTLERRGWDPEARALAVGTVLKHRGAPITTVIHASENLAGGKLVEAKHVAAAVELGASSKTPIGEIKKLAAQAERDLVKLSGMLAELKEGQGTAPELLAETMASQAIHKLNLLSLAFPGLQDRAVLPSRQIVHEVAAQAPKRPRKEGAETVVYVAGEGGRPKALKAKYRLVEADKVIASHNPETFGKREDYPEDVQERAYHRDKSEQAKVIRNAQRMDPRFVVNTNPDAVNGPPMVTADGVVLGGNSRAMSMQRIYNNHPDKAEEMRAYLEEHAHEVGLTPADVAGMKNPILIREVDIEDTSTRNLQLLVRQMNESFTQGMDPRTMQVAMGRRLDDDTLKALAGNIKEDETLAKFLANKRSEGFVNALFKAGVIDERNVNQYMKKGTRTLNQDGVQLVSRILVGRTVQDADLLSDTDHQVIQNVAQSVPALTQATVYGDGYALGPDLAVAISAFNDLQRKVDQGVIRNLDAKMPQRDFEQLFNHFRTLPGIAEPHPVLSNERAKMLLEVLIRRRGPIQMAKLARDYVMKAAQNPEGQATMFGAAKTPTEVLSETIESALGKERGIPVAQELFKSLYLGIVKTKGAIMSKNLINVDGEVMELVKSNGPYIGPKGGKWADPKHKIPWKENKPPKSYKEFVQKAVGALKRAGMRASKYVPKKGIKESGYKITRVPGFPLPGLQIEDWGNKGDKWRKEQEVKAVAALKSVGFQAAEVVEGGGMFKIRWMGLPSKELIKAEPRGGSYHRRIPKKSGKGYTYIYDEAKYSTRTDAHLHGPDARKARLNKAIMGAVMNAGKSGCAVKSLSALAAKEGKEHVAEVIKGCLASGDLTFKKGKLYSKSKKEEEKKEKSDMTEKSMPLVLDELRKAGPYKYKSRKKVKGHWVYEYDEPKKPEKLKLELQAAQEKRKAKAKRKEPIKPGGPDVPKVGKAPGQWGKLPPGKTIVEHVKIAHDFLRQHKAQLPQVLGDIKGMAGKDAKVKGRVKTLPSALGKMVKKPKYTTADKLQDGTGLRVIHGSVAEVKATVAKLREKYKVVEEDNYIDNPQGDYRSHHLIVEGPTGLAMEVQVRTENQNTFADWAHDVYKPMSEAQAAAVDHPDVAKYSHDISEYFWALDSGKKPPPKPPCTKVISEAFGCL
jgi:hypothetical protein